MNTQEQTKREETAEELKLKLALISARQEAFIGGFLAGGVIVAAAAALALLAGRRQ